MKCVSCIFFIIFISFQLCKGQISKGGLPYSFNHNIKKNKSLTIIRIPKPLIKNSLKDNNNKNSHKGMAKFGILQSTNINLQNSGNWITLESGDRLWQLKITSKDAKALMLYYDKFSLPKGAKFFVFNNNCKEIYGAYTQINNNKSSMFSTEMVSGDTINLEYYEPFNVKNKGIINIYQVCYVFKSITDNVYGFGKSGICNVNINCKEGDNYKKIKRSVLRCIMKDTEYAYYSTGVLVNNTDNDFKPYVLTARHNLITNEQNVNCAIPSDDRIDEFRFYFNYEFDGCESTTSENDVHYYSMTGAEIISYSNDCRNNAGSDFALLKLRRKIPTEYNPYFAGWDFNNYPVTKALCIHHPSGDVKKISKCSYTISSSYYGNEDDTHWKVNWESSENGHGITEKGSSGAPLFNSLNQVIGTLTGGAASCSNTYGNDYFGKFSYHWNLNDNSKIHSLNNWLDPNNIAKGEAQGIEYSDSIAKRLNNDISIYPNPANEKLTIEINKLYSGQKITIQIYNLFGMLIHTTGLIYLKDNIFTTNLHNFNDGVYIIEIKTDSWTMSKKLVINNLNTEN